MIRKLHESDEKMAIAYLIEEIAMNSFILGDIENLGFNSELQDIWGLFNDQAELEGMLLRYRKSYIPYVKSNEVDLSPFITIIESAGKDIILSGKKEIIERLTYLLPNHRIKDQFFCQLNSIENLNETLNGKDVKLAKADDADRVWQLLQEIEEFRGSAADVDEIKHKIETGTGRVYYLENENHEMISIAQTAAENSHTAMVVGVCTKPEYQKKGFVSQCLSALANDLLNEGRSLCLFYDNPNAGCVYHKLGFKTIGFWRMLTPLS